MTGSPTKGLPVLPICGTAATFPPRAQREPLLIFIYFGTGPDLSSSSKQPSPHPLPEGASTPRCPRPEPAAGRPKRPVKRRPAPPRCGTPPPRSTSAPGGVFRPRLGGAVGGGKSAPWSPDPPLPAPSARREEEAQVGPSWGRSCLPRFRFPSRQPGRRWILRRVVSPGVPCVLLKGNERAQV